MQAASAPVPQVPRFRDVMAGGLPGFAREGIVPIGLFYLGLKADGLALGIALSAAAGVTVYLYEHHRGQRGLMARLSLAFIAVQAVAGLASHSATVYLAQPVLLNALWALLYLGSVAAGRPLMGAIAEAWYPFPEVARRSATYRRVFGLESIVWGVYLLLRSALRLAVLLAGSLGSFFVVNIVTGLPITLALIAWSIWYSIRAFERSDEFDDVD